jgi:hypothetical protein
MNLFIICLKLIHIRLLSKLLDLKKDFLKHHLNFILTKTLFKSIQILFPELDKIIYHTNHTSHFISKSIIKNNLYILNIFYNFIHPSPIYPTTLHLFPIYNRINNSTNSNFPLKIIVSKNYNIHLLNNIKK